MADENQEINEQAENTNTENQEQGKEKQKQSGPGGSSMLSWVLIAMIVTVFGAGGGIAANILASSPQSSGLAEENIKAGEEILGETPGENRIQKEFEYYEFDSLTVNLDVQRQNRYLRVTAVLAIPKDEASNVTELLDKKKVELKNWIMTYLAGHTLEQVGGRKNMVRIQREMADSLNDQLWPNQKPRINHVLFKEYAVQ